MKLAFTIIVSVALASNATVAEATIRLLLIK
jgi:hypothetical protein